MSERKQYRYPGLKPFSTHEHQLFHGRGSDIRELYKIVRLENQLVLHSKSGLGKSSLLNAGLTPLLAKEPSLSPIRIRFSAYQGEDSFSPLTVIRKRVEEESEALATDLSGITAAQDTLWYLFKQKQSIEGSAITHILVFDQFEEIFTYPKDQIDDFKTQLAALLNNAVPKSFQRALEEEVSQNEITDQALKLIYDPLPVKAIYAIRSDKLSLIDELKDVLPDILTRTYRLLALDRDRAEDAILNPAYQKGDYASERFDFTDESLDAILDFLTEGGKQQVESFQLQIICQYVENKVIESGKTLIEKSDLGEIGAIFENYYEELIKRISNEADQQKARRLIEEGMILEGEDIRLSLHEGQITRDFDISQGLLEELVETRLIRAESSPRGGYVYELSHDTLIKPILRSKDRRLFAKRIQAEQEKREAELQAKRELEARRQRRILRAVGAGVLLIWFITIGWGQYSEYIQKTRNNEKLQVTVDSLLALHEAMLDSLKGLSQEEMVKQIEVRQTDIKEERSKLSQSLQASIHELTDMDLISQLHDPNRPTRERASTELAERLESTRGGEVLEKLMDYAIGNADKSDPGNWNVLYLVENHVPSDEHFKANMPAIETYLRMMREKEYGGTTQKRMRNIAGRILRLRQPVRKAPIKKELK